MTYSIEIIAEKGSVEIQEGVATAARTVLELEAAGSGSLSIVLTDEDTLRKANRQYAGIDRPTDVLSFADGEQLPDEDGIYYGDVLIAVPIAEEQARAGNHSAFDELVLLTVHGVLHLLGYDHDHPEAKDRMWSHQEAALLTLGIDPGIIKEQE
jgi:probable rRNA maturation factor